MYPIQSEHRKSSRKPSWVSEELELSNSLNNISPPLIINNINMKNLPRSIKKQKIITNSPMYEFIFYIFLILVFHLL